MKPRSSTNKNPSLLDADETRIIRATIILAIFLGFLVPLYTKSNFWPGLNPQKPDVQHTESSPFKSKIYPVLIQQNFIKPAFKDQYRALSEFNTDGAGGITTEYGFHTLSNTDIFQRGSLSIPGSIQSSDSQGKKVEGDEDHAQNQIGRKSKNTFIPSKKGMLYKIPTNYRFKQHMALRYDGRSLTAIATQSMPGASYFRNMIRQIRMTFAPPGQNYIIRDPYGYRMNQTINPQIVSVQFAIGTNGYITDVKVVSSIGQVKVDQACVEVLQNKNFGEPPNEIFRNGNIFGINFIFPDLRKYQ